MKSLLPIIVLALASSLPSAPPAAGPDIVSTTASPPRLELEALPGTTLQETLKITNASPTEQAYQVKFTDFIVKDNQGTPVAVTEKVSGRWSLASWLTVKPAKLLLTPGQTATVNLLISVPKDALPGGHYAIVTYSPLAGGTLGQAKQGVGGGSAIEPKVGTLIYFNVIGDVTEAANLKEFKVDKKFAYYGPINLFAEIENLGDVHIRPQGTVSVTNLLNDVIFSQNLEEKNIFPFASRTYDLTVPGKWRLGRYAARLEATAGSSQLPLHGLIYFWIVPVKEISLIAGALIIIILIIILKKRQPKPTPTPSPTASPGPENTA